MGFFMSILNFYHPSNERSCRLKLDFMRKHYGEFTFDDCCMLYAQTVDYLQRLPSFDPAVQKFYRDLEMAKQYGTLLRDFEQPDFSDRVVEIKNSVPFLHSEGMAGNETIIRMLCDYMKMERQISNHFPGYMGSRLVVLKPMEKLDLKEYLKYEDEFDIKTYGFVDPRLSIWPLK